jgi:hypothetical protein
MRRFTDSTALAERILAGLDKAMQDQPKTLRFWHTPSPQGGAPQLVASLDFVNGFPCLWVSFFSFYGEPVARFLQALAHCRDSGRVDEIEVCLRHVLEPARSLVFDGLADAGYAYSEDCNRLVWRKVGIG